MTKHDQSPRRQVTFWSACSDGGVVGTSASPYLEELIDTTAHENSHGILDGVGGKVDAAYQEQLNEWLSHETAQNFLNVSQVAAEASEPPVWRHRFACDTVVGGTDWWTLGMTGLQISHWRGCFLVYVAGKCLGGIELVFGVKPLLYFLANGIPYKGTLAAYSLGAG